MRITRKKLVKVIRGAILSEALDNKYYFNLENWIGLNRLVGNLFDIVRYIETPKFKRIANMLFRKGKGNSYQYLLREIGDIYTLIDSLQKNKKITYEEIKYLEKEIIFRVKGSSQHVLNLKKERSISGFKRFINHIKELESSMQEILDRVDPDSEEELVSV